LWHDANVKKGDTETQCIGSEGSDHGGPWTDGVESWLTALHGGAHGGGP
jgi:hypothetical protein